MNGQGVRLSEFARAVGIDKDKLRTLIVREQVPFFDRVKSGKRRIYAGSEALAMSLTELLVAAEKIPWSIAADRVLLGSAVNDFLSKREQGQQTKDLWFMTKREWDHHPYTTSVPSGGMLLTPEHVSRNLVSEDIYSISLLRVQDAYDRAVEIALDNGFILAGKKLFKHQYPTGR